MCVFQVEPYLPYEYTCEGMLERVHSYIQHQVRSMWRRILTERGTKHTHAEILSFIFSPSLSLTHAYTPVLKLPLCSIFHRCVCSTPRTLCISAGVCVCLCVCHTILHVCRFMINLHASSHYEPHICPRALRQKVY